MTAAEHVDAHAALADEARGALADSGIFRAAHPVDDAVFRAACEELGDIVYEADIRLGAARPRNYQLPAEIGFHTDHVSAEIVAWRCVTAQQGGGEMRFLDLARIADRLDEAQRAALARVGVADNAAWGGGEPIPLAVQDHGRLRFHYVPWLQRFPADAEAGAALAAFEAAFRAAADDYVEVALWPGECVFLDNHRIAHGRAAIPADSPRHLTRLWIEGRNSSGM
jgi:alpha-ketoglutarate-dependent taurine dioxygenase